MKKLITLLIALLISISTFAQQGINYKAVVKDAGGNILANQNMKVRFIIKKSNGTSIYIEDHTTTSNANGIVILNIGEGTPGQFQDFNTIDWADDNYSLRVGIDPELDGTFIYFDDTEFKKVPYALHATKADYAVSAESATFKTIDNVTSNSPGDLNNDDFVFGSTQLDNGVSSGNSRMFFDKSKASFRAGLASGDEWNVANVGNRSAAFGLNTIAKGSYSTAFGNRTRAEANVSTAIGAYNVGGGNPTVWVGTDPLFEIGNGTASLTTEYRNNALTVYKNGNTDINGNAYIQGELFVEKELRVGMWFGVPYPGAIGYNSDDFTFYGETGLGVVKLGGKRNKSIVIPSAAFNLSEINDFSIDKTQILYTGLSVSFISEWRNFAGAFAKFYLVAPISLPAGSIINKITYVFEDNDSPSFIFKIVKDCSLINESPVLVTNDLYADIYTPGYTVRSTNLNEVIGKNCQYIMTIEKDEYSDSVFLQRMKFYRAIIEYTEE